MVQLLRLMAQVTLTLILVVMLLLEHLVQFLTLLALQPVPVSLLYLLQVQ
jgi:hypothetical protein